MSLLGVNIDHVATIRQARRTYEPDPVWAAVEAQLGGADLITLHLRQDRRHICDRDLNILKQTVSVPLNLEMSMEEEIVQLALETHPDMVTIVPEKREEVTTEGGLDVCKQPERLRQVLAKFQESGINTSLFVDPELDQIDACKEVGTQMVELHTGTYANSRANMRSAELEKLTRSAAHGRKLELIINAGHGLTYSNVAPLVRAIAPKELHIGHSIISRSVFSGIKQAVSDMKDVIQKSLLINI